MGQIEFKDKTLRCCDCGESFIFSAGEQAFYYSKGLSQPKRCQACRELRKRTIIPGEIRDSDEEAV